MNMSIQPVVKKAKWIGSPDMKFDNKGFEFRENGIKFAKSLTTRDVATRITSFTEWQNNDEPDMRSSEYGITKELKGGVTHALTKERHR